jgi:hypothetical protein
MLPSPLARLAFGGSASRKFGSLWQKWVEDIAAAVEALRKAPRERAAAAPVASSQPKEPNIVGAATSPTNAAALLNDES